ncbi:IgG-like domain protein [Stenotrophomonas phage Philippe]|uniref:IgG-like domain protein n=1 Tax=Stenotrophomonas phage Philippe TaxID=2859655 RepID=A0AAE7WMJ4_9CAUD|nr:IgG-like domain protein [Stenotrophomonas phage Philippe]QYW02227.1 IgG-like domain protein [Stenotrophomonas phage Philippe]
MRYQISIDNRNPLDKHVNVDAVGTALEAGFTKIGEFDHGDEGDETDSLPKAPVSHVLYHHVQEALYHAKNVQPVVGGFWPDNITDMQTVSIHAPVAVTAVDLTPDTATVDVGDTVQLVPTFTPNTATNKSVTYQSSAPATATVSETGLVTGVAAGEATITVTTASGAKTATSVVTVE